MPDDTNDVLRLIGIENHLSKTYEIYEAENAEKAKSFLSKKKVLEPNYYIVIETPEGNWGLDKMGIFLEGLQPFQKDILSATHTGKVCGNLDLETLKSAAQGISDNAVFTIECGNCKSRWLDGLRYNNLTVAKCPKCKTLNKVDTANFTVVIF